MEAAPTMTPPPIESAESVYSIWYSHLILSFIAIIICRIVGVLLPTMFPIILNAVLPSCRARRAACAKADKEIRELRKQMAELNMVDNFAAYSKLQRKVNVLEKQRSTAERSQLGTTVCSLIIFF